MSGNTPEILALFKEQLNNQVATIVATHHFATQGYGFAYWYLFNIGEKTDIEAKEQICDGGGDLGIDAIEIVDELVVFYQFKNPASIEKAVEAGEIDKMISGLELILSRKHEGIANPELMSRLEEIYGFTPAGYKIVVAASCLADLPPDAKTKLDNFCQKNSGVAKDLFRWEYNNLEHIHNRFYSAHLPTLERVMHFFDNNAVHCNDIRALHLGWNQRDSSRAVVGSVIPAMLPMKSGRSARPILPS